MSIAYSYQFFLQGIFIGMLLMMLLYNLLLYISQRDKSYLYYVLYVFLTMVFNLNSYNYFREFMASGSTILPKILEISLISSYVFYFMLMRIFIGSKERNPRLYKTITWLLNFLIISTPIVFVCILVDIRLYEIASRIISPLVYFPTIVILILMLKNGDKLARYFAIGSMTLFAGVAYILSGVFTGHDPKDYFYGYQLGVIAQVFIFSIGLSYRYEQMKNETIQSKHKALSRQIDPHFFFNSLSVLTSLIYKDADKSAEYVNQLSKVYRTILDKSDENLVLLDNELKLQDSYIYLMKIRFGDNISITIDITDESRKNTLIPPNTLQLLVENAIKHNKCSTKEPLFISISEDAKNIYIKNNINRRAQVDESSGIGLENIRNRFLLLKGKEIETSENDNTFTVKLPKYTWKDFEKRT